MGLTFWLSLGGGAAIGFVVSLLANYFTPTFSDFVNRRRSNFIERNKKRALENFRTIKDLHEGQRDKYLYLMELWGLLHLSVIFGTGFFVILTILNLLKEAQSKAELLARLTITIAALVCFMMAIFLMVLVRLVGARLRNFDAYKAALG